MGKGSRQNRSVTSGKGLALRAGLVELAVRVTVDGERCDGNVVE